MSASLASQRDRDILRSYARRIDPSDAGAHNNLGVLYYHKGMYEDAVAAFTKALELDPKMQVAQRNLEVAYFNCCGRQAMLLGIVKRGPNEDALPPLEAAGCDVCFGDPGHDATEAIKNWSHVRGSFR